ncbi:hypothetical protein F511_19085 [Dorcoceras hygrometricum]|uniref:Uncharacterized protein n=1 Tax=Dorcoceras hygrometricum TaxID=472368 RepID=A0A2Z7C5V8_9LAMI|nr:hypothetical protein F511_19085 [Dorcoceras hygrometricum]
MILDYGLVDESIAGSTRDRGALMGENPFWPRHSTLILILYVSEKGIQKKFQASLKI